MTPFEEFRLWLRQGAPGERAAAGVAALLAAVLVVWVLLPTTKGVGSTTVASSSGVAGAQPQAIPTTTGGVGAGATNLSTANPQGGQTAQTGSVTAPAGGVGSSAPAVGSSNASGNGASSSGSPTGNAVPGASPSGGTGTVGSASCGTPGATDQGVTSTTLTIGITLIDVAGANSILGVPSPSVQQAEDSAYVSSINANGGIHCRKLVPKFYTDNPLDPNSEHSLCLQILSDKVFAVIGDLYTAQNQTCLPQNHIPVFNQTPTSSALIQQFAPYIFTPGSSQYVFADYVLGAKQEGWFKGLGKLGVLTETCYSDFNPEVIAALARAGIPSNKIETYSFGCPTGSIPDPATVEGAVLQFQRDGVTHVMSAGAPLGGFSSQAESQGYHPHYVTSDIDGTVQLNGSGGDSVNAQNFNGALSITTQQYGALNSNTPLSPATAQCDAIMKKGGAPAAESGDGYAGGVCTQFAYFVNAATREGSLIRTGLAAGLDRTGSVDLPYPDGPSNWSGSGVTWGGQNWRADTFSASCSCWKVSDATWHAQL